MVLTATERRAKLGRLAELEGYVSVEDLLEAASGDSVSPAICVNAGCDHTAEMEPDQDAGHCEECGTRSMQAALVLAGLI